MLNFMKTMKKYLLMLHFSLSLFVTLSWAHEKGKLVTSSKIKRFSGIDIVQLHGHENLDYCKKINGTIWKAFRVKDER